MTKSIKFEEAFNRLEEIARQLEGGELSLDESMELYEEGMKLLDLCNKKLTSAEQKILKLSRSAGGDFETEPLDGPVKE